MSDNLDPQPIDPGLVKYLRLLVTGLTATMIVGLIVIVALFVTKFSTEPALTLPDQITLPDGAHAQAFTQGDTWYAIVTTDQSILIYDRVSGGLRQTIVLSDGPDPVQP